MTRHDHRNSPTLRRIAEMRKREDDYNERTETVYHQHDEVDEPLSVNRERLQPFFDAVFVKHYATAFLCLVGVAGLIRMLYMVFGHQGVAVFLLTLFFGVIAFFIALITSATR